MRMLRRLRSKTSTKPNLDQSLVLHLSKSRIPGPRQLKYLGKFLSPMERLIVLGVLLISAGALVYMGVIFYKKHIEIVPDDGGRYTEGIVGNPQYINPLYSSLNDADADLDRLIFSRLYTRDAEGRAVPDLADEVKISDGGKTYTISLKEARWQNGEILTADDVVYTFNLIQNPDYKSPLRSKFSGVNAKTIDEQTVVFSLREAYRNFPRLLDFGILPENVWSAVSPQTIALAELNIKPIGSGPYRFKSLTKAKTGTVRSYVLERNEDYYGQRPHLDELVFKFFPSVEEMVAAENNGQLSGMAFIDADSSDSLVAKNSIEYHQSASTDLAALFLNLKDKGFVSDKKIRQALSLTIDQSSIVSQSVGRWGLATKTLLPSFMPGNHDVFATDTEAAARLLESAGWQKQGSEWQKDAKPLLIRLTASEDQKKIAEAVTKQWQNFGIKTEITYKSSDELTKIVSDRQFEVALYGVEMPDGDPFAVWQSGSAANLSSWGSKDSDAWMIDARLTSDENLAAERYGKFLTAAADDIPAIPLFWKAYVYPQSKKIKGFQLANLSDPSERFSMTAQWYLKTSRRYTPGS